MSASKIGQAVVEKEVISAHPKPRVRDRIFGDRLYLHAGWISGERFARSAPSSSILQ